MALLTDRTLAASSAITASTLIHIVDVNDFSQNPAGSSYKAELSQLTDFFSNFYVNVSGDTMVGDLVVPNFTASTIQVTTGANTGYILTSLDNFGTSSWQPLSSLSGSSVISVTGVTTTPFTATTTYSYYGVTNLGGTSIEIPDPSGIDGYTIRIKDETGTASLNPITITPASGSIDGSGSVSMSINYMSLTMVARNNNWWII